MTSYLLLRAPILLCAGALLALAACTDRATDVPHGTGSCGKPRPPAFSGELCGRSANPCQLEVKERIASDPKLGGGTLELDEAGEPMVVHTMHHGDFPAYFLRRPGSGPWTKEELPFAVGRGTLARVGAEPYLFADDGAQHRQILRRSVLGWSVFDQLPGEGEGGWAGAMAADQAGCLHLRLSEGGSGDGLATYGLRQSTGAWSFHELSPGLDGGPITLGPDGTPQFAYWGRLAADSTDKPRSLLWVAYPGQPELVMVGSHDIFVDKVALAISPSASGGGGTPYVLVEHVYDSRYGALTLATRAASGEWSLQAVASTPPPTECTYTPTQTDETCVAEYPGNRLLGVLSTATPGELRILYGKTLERHEYTASCPGAGGCSWKSTTKFSGSIRLVAVRGGVLEEGTVVDGITPEKASMVVDGSGRIHVVIYGAATSSALLGTDLYYLRLGPKQ